MNGANTPAADFVAVAPRAAAESMAESGSTHDNQGGDPEDPRVYAETDAGSVRFRTEQSTEFARYVRQRTEGRSPGRR